MGYVGQGNAADHAREGLVLDLVANKANSGTLRGVNNPATTVWTDLSGNGNNGALNGFAYTEQSGWTDGLNFAGIEYVRLGSKPTLDPANFSYQINDQIVSHKMDSQSYIKNGVVAIAGRNLVVNGDFTSTAGWTVENGSLTVASNTAIVTANGLSPSTPLYKQIPITYVSGKKIYIKANMRVTNSVSNRIEIRIYSNNFANVVAASLQVSPIASQYYNFSNLITLPSGWISGNIKIYLVQIYANSATANGKVMEVQQIFALDLPATFGAGNEPTKAWCDANIAWTPAPEDIIANIDTINLQNPYLVGTKIQTYKIYNRALTDAEILQNYNAGDAILDPAVPVKTVRKYLKIFDRFHTILDEADKFSGLKYGWTLNGFGKANFSIGLESTKNTPANLEFMNHVEVWDNTGLIWGGKIVDRAFSDGKTDMFMYGYLSMLDKRRFIAHSYTERTYGALFTAMLADINAIEATGVTLGIIQTGSLNTQRIVDSKDFLLKKLQDYCVDGNYDMDVDNDRKLNFYLRKGNIKSQYILEYGGQTDNILVAPSLAQSSLNLANSVYSETSTLTSIATDTLSRALYSLQESVLSGNDSIILQDTLNNNISSELQRSAYPANSLSLRIKDSTLCPYSDVEVGDSIPVHLILSKNWDFMDTLRILEMTHNEDDGTRDLVVGQTLYRPAPAQIKQYRK